MALELESGSGILTLSPALGVGVVSSPSIELREAWHCAKICSRIGSGAFRILTLSPALGVGVVSSSSIESRDVGIAQRSVAGLEVERLEYSLCPQP